MSYASDQGVLNGWWNAGECATQAAVAMMQPHVLMRPAIYPDGNSWCALYGEDLQCGVAGFGETPALACADFNKNWNEQNLSKAAPHAR